MKSLASLISLPDLSKEIKMGDGESEQKESKVTAGIVNLNKQQPKGVISRIWNGIFRLNGDDIEKRLAYISKEEASLLSGIKKRSLSRRRTTRNLIIFTLFFEIIAVGYAIMTTRSTDLNWKMRAFRVLPMFLLPALSSLFYSSFLSFTRMRDLKDQKTLEKLRTERQAKIDELKEKTNYYTTQQLIQRYDPDPAAKAAAATILASKLGADSGLKVYVGDESLPTGRSSDVEVVQSRGLRNRKQLHTKSSSTGSSPMHHIDEETPRSAESEVPRASERSQLVVVDHHNPQGSTTHDGGWIARIAALLVGEDPTQSYALICGNCHMHNGLAMKEDFPYITYYCPHCRALNRPKQLEEHVLGSVSPNMSSLTRSGNSVAINNSGPANDSVLTSNSPAGLEKEEVNEKVTSRDLDSILTCNSPTGSEIAEVNEKVTSRDLVS
ncbi:DUF2296 domain-containing protein [Cephalotus follicularis]|uniref:DUF2296 domain-containing protein n=1 Tax=Cephalotus follicularis TaxID=3775 RepID=A0A1Q3CJM8_CEPFO|nr:DUF2296 domain-containing protein [Cephalotus follicularis]